MPKTRGVAMLDPTGGAAVLPLPAGAPDACVLGAAGLRGRALARVSAAVGGEAMTSTGGCASMGMGSAARATDDTGTGLVMTGTREWDSVGASCMRGPRSARKVIAAA